MKKIRLPCSAVNYSKNSTLRPRGPREACGKDEHGKHVDRSSVRVCFAFDRPKDDTTACSSPPWWHSEDGPYWAGPMDQAHNVQGGWPHGHSVLETPLRAGECVCSRTDCGYVFHNMGADIIPLAFSNCSMWHTREQTARLRHILQYYQGYNFGSTAVVITSVCRSFCFGWSEYQYSSSDSWL